MSKPVSGVGFKRPLTWVVFALLAGGFLMLAAGFSEPDLKPWHTEDLTAEFTADKADEIGTFDAYKKLEDGLFRELDEKVYAHVETGPQYALFRYSTGSTADPRGREPNRNRSFFLSSENAVGSVLLLHGLTDAPYTLSTLGKALNERGYAVLGLRLPGHGTAPSGLRNFAWRDMAAAVRLAVTHLASKNRGKPIHIVGYSTGAPLALDFALDALAGNSAPLPASLVLISPAIGIHPTAALAGMKNTLSALPGLGGLAWLQIVPEFDPYKYNSFAANAGSQVHRLTKSVAQRVRELDSDKPSRSLPPILVFKSAVDATVTTSAVVDRLLGRLPPNRNELVLFDINRYAVKSKLMVADPGPLTDRLVSKKTLPFALTLVANENKKSTAVVARHKKPLSSEFSETTPLDLNWPEGVISLSHVALPFEPDDPIYGQRPPENDDMLFLGQMAIQGERGLLNFPADWLLRLRHNPFYAFLQQRSLEWIDAANGRAKTTGTKRDQ